MTMGECSAYKLVANSHWQDPKWSLTYGFML